MTRPRLPTVFGAFAPCTGIPGGRGERLRLAARLLAVVLWLLAAGSLAPARARGAGQALQTGIDLLEPVGPESATVMAHARATGARFARLVISWSAVAPANPPPGFDPANPEASSYRWSELDRLISAALAGGLEPILDIMRPPAWAQSPPGAGPQSPDPLQLSLFAHAAALRYDGSRPGLPRVRYWEVWNEPNASLFLGSPTQGGRVVSVDGYRTMVNDFASGVHGARADDVVIAGELFPNGVNRPGLRAIAPLDFTRRLFCLSAGAHPHLVCRDRVSTDVWSVHPYTSGGPSTLPANPDNVWIANLGSLSRLVQAAQRLGSLVSRGGVQTWVTEFSWDSDPPDPLGVPLRLEQRWVAETLYRSWQAGIGVFTWFLLRDQPLGSSPFQSGLYFACSAIDCDTPKPAAGAFRFPFVAYLRPRRRVLVWGRTPAGVPGEVQIQSRRGLGWQTIATLRTDRDGIFTARLALAPGTSPSSGVLRALELGVGPSPSFALHHPPDIHVNPFGS